MRRAMWRAGAPGAVVCAILASALFGAGCVEPDEGAATRPVLETQQRALESGPAPWEGPTPLELCTEYYPMCAQLCNPATPYPGTPGYCCATLVDRTTCTEAGVYSSGPDRDGDGYPDDADNCPMASNPGQENRDGDRWGDACDLCPDTKSDDLSDHDGDGTPSACDDDDDDDGIPDRWDPCPIHPSTAYDHAQDLDRDGVPDLCDPDDDGDGHHDRDDNCPRVANPSQDDLDRDGIGDWCESQVVHTMRAERVRRVSLAIGGTLTDSDYAHWDNALVPVHIQTGTLLARPVDPPTQDVRHVAFFAAGQQSGAGIIYPTGGGENGLSGQPMGYMQGWATSDAAHNVPVSFGMMNALLGSRMTSRDTFVGVSLEPMFNYEFSPLLKAAVVEAHYRWLESQFNPTNIQSIYLAGHSRGGCLAAQLAARFHRDYPDALVIAHLHDPVCTPNHAEFGVTFNAVVNPLDTPDDEPDWFMYTTDMNAQFAPAPGRTRANLRVLNHASGQDVFGVAHGMTHHGAPDQLAEPAPLGGVPNVWYEQRWTTLDHMAIGWVRWAGLLHYDRACAATGRC